MIDTILQRKIELGLSFRDLAKQSGVSVAALKDATERASMEHFSLGQLRRLCASLSLDLTACLEPPSISAEDHDSSSEELELSDAALNLLLNLVDDERSVENTIPTSNPDRTDAPFAELVAAGFLEVKRGRIAVDPTVANSLGAISPVELTPGRTVRFSHRLAREMNRSLCPDRKTEI